MLSSDEEERQGREARLSRRGFLLAATLAAARASLPAPAAAAAPAAGPLFAYVGSYSSPQGPEGSKGYGRGIYLFEMNPASGALVQREVFANGANPSWLAFNPARTRLYAANETATYQGARSGSVSAYADQPPRRTSDAAQYGQLRRGRPRASQRPPRGQARAGGQLRRRDGGRAAAGRRRRAGPRDRRQAPAGATSARRVRPARRREALPSAATNVPTPT